MRVHGAFAILVRPVGRVFRYANHAHGLLAQMSKGCGRRAVRASGGNLS